MTETTLSRAQAGDGDAFRELTDPYRRELQVHCYRILGSVQDAEDVLQEALLSAWRSIGSFDGGSLRAWLYRIATNRCLNHLRDRRPLMRVNNNVGAPQKRPSGAESSLTLVFQPLERAPSTKRARLTERPMGLLRLLTRRTR